MDGGDWLWLLAIVLMLWSFSAEAHHRDSRKYDQAFAKYQHRYAPAEIKREWLLLKAQAIVESGLRPDAVSPAGAQGLLQFMPLTWREWGDGSPTPLSAKASIKAGARYMRWQWNNWSGRVRTKECQQALALAGYNAGIKHILKAQMLANDALCFDEIKSKLPEVTGHNSVETINYTVRNEREYKKLGGNDLWR